MAKPKNGEIIWRIKYQTNATGKTVYAEPVILILADKAGWQFLADQFSAMAKRKITKDTIACGDPDDHRHIGINDRPVNKALSHQLEFRLGILSPKSRNETLKKYQLNESGAEGNLQHIFNALIASADKSVKESNELFQRIENEPEKLDDQFETIFGIKLATGKPSKRKAKKK